MNNFLDFLSTALLIGAWVAASLTVAALLALAGVTIWARSGE